MTNIEKALSDYLGEVCGMRLQPHALTGLAQAAIAAMQPAPQEPVAWMYERGHSRQIHKTRLRSCGLFYYGEGWTETPLYAGPTPPNGGSDAGYAQAVADVVAWLRGERLSDTADHYARLITQRFGKDA